MKRSIKIIIGSIMGVVVIAGIALAANGDFLQGRMFKLVDHFQHINKTKVERPKREEKILPAYDETKYEKYKNDPMSPYNWMSSDDSTSSDDCKTYTTPGTHTLSPCDSIEYKDFSFKFELSSYISYGGVQGSLTYPISPEYDYQDNRVTLKEYTDFNFGPFITTNDTNLVLEELNYSPFTPGEPLTFEAKIHLYETCAEVREVCENNNITVEEHNKIKCDSICPNQEDNPDKDYY